MGAECLSAALRIPHNFPNTHAKAPADPLQSVQLQVLLAALDSAVVRPVHGDLIGKCLLAMPRGFASNPKGLTNTLS